MAIKAAAIDAKAREYQQLKGQADSLDKQLTKKREELLQLINKHGKTPAKADKSKRLEGYEFRLTASYGESVSVDEEIARKIEALCGSFGLEDFFERLFKKSLKYSLAVGAQQALESSPNGRFKNMFAKAVKVTSKTPTLKVEYRKVEAA